MNSSNVQEENVSIRKRLLNMSINALIGYLIVEVSATGARLLGLTSIRYGEILALAAAANFGTLAFIAVIYRMKELSPGEGRAFFIGESLFFFIMFSMAVFRMQEFRIMGLVFALVAITIELPFTTFYELLFISGGAALAQVCVSFYAVHYARQSGSFGTELFYTICLLPALIIISYVARQISLQRRVIQSDKRMLEEMNEQLRASNAEIVKARGDELIEMELACQIQESFLPALPGDRCGWDLALHYKPRRGVSGDFYDFYIKDDVLRGMAIFDVSGHGVSSALLTMLVKPAVYREFTRMDGHGLGHIIRRVNEHMTREISSLDSYITGLLLRFSGSSVEYINAGHTDLLLRKSGSGKVKTVEAGDTRFKGEPVGLRRETLPGKTLQFNVASGDVLLLYTDGILEGGATETDRFGRDRLMASLEAAPAGSSREILDHIIGDFIAFMNYQEIKDDITLIVARKMRE